MIWLLCSAGLFAAFLFRAATLPLSSLSDPGKNAPVDPLLITRSLYAASVVALCLWLSSLGGSHVVPHAVSPSAADILGSRATGSVVPGSLDGHSVVSIGESTCCCMESDIWMFLVILQSKSRDLVN
jgi:hypothetical protein